jgi:hypothetical protein
MSCGGGATAFDGVRGDWSELTATNTLVEDEPVEPVSQMIISLLASVFFFLDPPCPKILYQISFLPPPSYLPSTSPLLPTTYLPPPTYRLPTPPPLTPSPELQRPRAAGAKALVLELELWLWSGSSSGTHAPTRPTRPRGGKMLTFSFVFSVCLFVEL